MVNIIRVFRAQIHAGRENEFRAFFDDQAIPEIREQDGLVQVIVGAPSETNPSEFVMISIWSDLEKMKRFVGDTWQEALIVPEEAPLIVKAEVYHFEAFE